MHTIKRYSNRKLYDPQAGRYITLEEIGQAVRHGEDLRVVDHSTGADLTTLTLLQVVLEDEKKARGWLPHNLLARLIRAGENRINILRAALVDFMDTPETFEKEIHRRVEILEKTDRLKTEEADRFIELICDPEIFEVSTSEQSQAATSDEVKALSSEVDRLNHLLDEMLTN